MLYRCSTFFDLSLKGNNLLVTVVVWILYLHQSNAVAKEKTLLKIAAENMDEPKYQSYFLLPHMYKV